MGGGSIMGSGALSEAAERLADKGVQGPMAADILLVEDDAFVAQVLSYYLEEKRFKVVCAGTAGEALGLAHGSYDVILLDIMLPDADGIGLCRQLRRWYDGPIIFFSCLDDSETIIKALDAGGDDFLVKPFDNDVLLARIEANLRRARNEYRDTVPRCIECGPFSLDVQARTLRKDDVELRLPPMEARLLAFLMQHRGRHFPSEELYRHVWGRDCCGDPRTVLVHISHLRTKLEDDPKHCRYLRSVWGKGYVFDCDGAPSSGDSSPTSGR